MNIQELAETLLSPTATQADFENAQKYFHQQVEEDIDPYEDGEFKYPFDILEFILVIESVAYYILSNSFLPNYSRNKLTAFVLGGYLGLTEHLPEEVIERVLGVFTKRIVNNYYKEHESKISIVQTN